MNILSAALLLITVFLNFKHGWAILKANPGDANMFSKWGLSKTAQNTIGLLTLAGGMLIIFPITFLAGNIINAALILAIMILHLKHKETKPALLEIPFLLIPLVMICLGYPVF